MTFAVTEKGKSDMARKKRKTEGYVLKSDVETLIQNLIRNIQMNDYGNDSGIPQLYTAMNRVGNLPTADVAPRSEVAREIFEGIESFINKKLALLIGVFTEGEIELAFKALVMVQDYLTELKKKYTEERTD
jgi:hypothetical protein